jgi:Holliday junction resolvase RusA-like endonuclease
MTTSLFETPGESTPPVVDSPGPSAGLVVAGEDTAGPALVITAYGRPVTQGHKVRNRYGGVRDSNAATLHPWRDRVCSAAIETLAACECSGGMPHFDGPVAVSIVFTFARPTWHWRTGRNAHLLRDNAPAYPISIRAGDIDTLVRAVLDSLTDAGVWKGDNQVARLHGVAKVYVGSPDSDALDRPGAVVRIAAIT